MMSENKCPQCGAPIEVGATECKFCGEKLVTQKVTGSAVTVATSDCSSAGGTGNGIRNQSFMAGEKQNGSRYIGNFLWWTGSSQVLYGKTINGNSLSVSFMDFCSGGYRIF